MGLSGGKGKFLHPGRKITRLYHSWCHPAGQDLRVLLDTRLNQQGALATKMNGVLAYMRPSAASR